MAASLHRQHFHRWIGRSLLPAHRLPAHRRCSRAAISDQLGFRFLVVGLLSQVDIVSGELAVVIEDLPGALTESALPSAQEAQLIFHSCR